MLMMRDFVIDPKLHKALDVVEDWMGYAIPAAHMSLQHQMDARASMKLNENTGLFELLYIDDEPLNQAGCCHELAHLIVWINGAVIKYDFDCPFHPLLASDPVMLFLKTIWKYMQHVPVFKFVHDFGYDEIPDYDTFVPSLITLMQQNQFNPAIWLPSWDPARDQVRCQAGYLVQHLALPITNEMRATLRNTAQEEVPQALELADAILSALGQRTLLGRQEYEEYLSEIYQMAWLPKSRIIPNFLRKTSPNFIPHILEEISS